VKVKYDDDSQLGSGNSLIFAESSSRKFGGETDCQVEYREDCNCEAVSIVEKKCNYTPVAP
jgi:hypothetical protein